ncbi:malto-oligosyltrehalose synthase [Wenxinia saemankumensis]|uniref:Maltooligosyl trehalose synthase n=1 Tax=Wenxinia saemankumensis TaxID=1447782 RepID=A0A1M6EW48_9RHOB|nr:malto-oligosyltrehalose synthase [Wenxinia saemankumensis]SHI89643.1 maltooligosyl trehalose synthase [Wenxinia saemankumensis]
MTRIASYRVQLRDGLDFDGLVRRLDHIAGLGVSHLYLSPILTAPPGSTHGYDVTDPTAIDPELGGREGFERLARAAGERGLKIILDIVPNHMAFGLDTPWLVDVLRHGPASRRAAVFDIDWGAGPLALPWLERPLPEMAEAGEVEVLADGMLRVGALHLPLAPGSADGLTGTPDPATAESLHEAQHWRLLPWQMERDSITHRRFFSVTSLIGVRVEDPEVFETTHALLFELVEAGHVHGLRVDHVDGLVDPGGYLRALADRLPDTPVWIEKIVVGDEALPDWPMEGTTGYETAAAITRLLTDPAGLDVLDATWREATGAEGDFHAAVAQAKREVLTDELAAELRQLRRLADAAAEADGFLAGPESLREAITELLVAFPRYRSYLTADGPARDEDVALWRAAADEAAANVRLRDTIDWVVDRILARDTPDASRLALRLQQVTGALIAKSHEDTAGFRFNRYIAANEVGADPDRPVAEAAEIGAFLQDRRERWPGSINLGSTHDTKRSEDARARLVALTHDPEAFRALWTAANAQDGSDGLPANLRLYALQSAIAIHGEPDAEDRLAEHLVKALREGKEVTYWNAPDETPERRIGRWACGLLAAWEEPPEELLRIDRLAEAIGLRELGLRAFAPGMPDIYQGGEGRLIQLTDPDNRRTPDWSSLAALGGGDTHADRKRGLLAALLDLRRRAADLFARGDVTLDGDARAGRILRIGSGTACFAWGQSSAGVQGDVLWSDETPGAPGGAVLTFAP